MLFFMPHEQNSESACKPGSVKNGHLSVACDCSQAQATSRERPGRPYALSAVLLRIEFTAPACLHAAGELLPRLSTLTYLAFPPLLKEMQSISKSGISLLHLSEGHPWRALPVILALWSPDFPHAQAFALYPRPFG